ncbi:ABC transporter permease [Bradyrhizobium sp. BRP14]|nr:ABC transporter permease [Bradyrhizobium sp. BRP14]
MLARERSISFNPARLVDGAAWLVLAFLMSPIIVILPLAFSSGTFLSYPIPGVSLRWFETIAQPYPWVDAFWNSIKVGACVTVLATVIGTIAAFGVAKRPLFGGKLVQGLLVLPMVVPIVISALAFYFFFSWIGIVGTFTALVLAHTVLALPFVFIAVSASLARFDRGLVSAAYTLGATPSAAFLQVSLPITLPGILTGAIFAFVTSFDEVVVAQFVGGPDQITLPRLLFAQLREQLDPSLVAVAFVLFAISCLAMFAFQFLVKAQRS